MFKILIVVILCGFLFFGCSLGKQIIKLDQQNYEANKTLAKETLKTWSFNSGFITCAGFADKIKFPVTTASEARALLQNSQITLGLAELDEIAKKRGFWIDEDYDYGCSLGIRARTAVLAVTDILKLFPTIAPYVGGIIP
jgi:PIN domain nuclease of toxin-antitoxin system